MSSGRFPVRPLEYKDRDKAIPKELIVDYENKTIYASDGNGNIIPFDSGPIGPAGPNWCSR